MSGALDHPLSTTAAARELAGSVAVEIFVLELGGGPIRSRKVDTGARWILRPDTAAAVCVWRAVVAAVTEGMAIQVDVRPAVHNFVEVDDAFSVVL